jgi:hypothetical protein
MHIIEPISPNLKSEVYFLFLKFIKVMKFLLFIAIFITGCCAIQAQISPTQDATVLPSIEKDTVYTNPEIEPAYPGGQFAWQRYLKVALRYPDEAMDSTYH